MLLSKRSAMVIAGVVWLCVALLLLSKGVQILLHMERVYEGKLPILEFFTLFSSNKVAIFILVALALLLGAAKGWFVLRRGAHRVISRIKATKGEVTIRTVYQWRECLVLGLMVLIGMGMKRVSLPFDVRGAIDLAIGMGLFVGSMIYFGHGRSVSTCGKEGDLQ